MKTAANYYKIKITKMSQEIFKFVFGESWNRLPPVMRKHYANRPRSKDSVIVEGKMDIEFGIIFKILAPLLRLLKMLVPYQGQDIFVRVTFLSEENSDALCFNREFYFAGKAPVQFFSRMIVVQKNEIIELMKCKIGWRFCYSFENGKVLLKHRGYNLFLFGKFISLPLTLLFGEGYAEEEALSEDEFAMKMTIKHFLFGKIYEYRGRFKIIKNIA